MKFRVFFTPFLAVIPLWICALLLWAVAIILPWPWGLALLPFALFYSALSAICGWALWRIRAIERWTEWDTPRRLLILAPHEDDCVISAGGIGWRNQRLGGVTRIVYLAPDEAPDMAARRADEARAAWRQAGLQPMDMLHLDLLPPLRQRDPQRLHAAARTLRSIIDDFQPSTLVMPMFEGGHIHHDMVAALIGLVVTPSDRFDVFEAPEYSPYASLNVTPHRMISLCSRWLFGLVSYYGPPDGIDDRPILKFRLTPAELEGKRGMLAAFVSQNAPSLVETRAYPDRLARWSPDRRRRYPFDFSGSYLRFALAARRLFPARLVDRLLPVEHGTIGREGAVTDWTEEWEAAGGRSAQ